MKDFLSAAQLQELLPGIESAEPQGQKDPKWERDLVAPGGTGGTNALEIGGWRMASNFRGIYEKSYLVWFLSKL